jgi:hypothetical protein
MSVLHPGGSSPLAQLHSADAAGLAQASPKAHAAFSKAKQADGPGRPRRLLLAKLRPAESR